MYNNYDDWKLASPPEQDLCRYCDSSDINESSDDNFRYLNKELYKTLEDLQNAVYSVIKLQAQLSTVPIRQGSNKLSALIQQICEKDGICNDDDLEKIEEQLESEREKYLEDQLGTFGLCRSCHDDDDC